MGFSFRRSVKLPGGVRVNMSHRGVSGSVGAGGLRYSTGTARWDGKGKGRKPRGTAPPRSSAATSGPAPARPTTAERNAAQLAAQRERLGAAEFHRRRRINGVVLAVTGLLIGWLFSLAFPPLLLAVIPLTVWAIVAEVKYRRRRDAERAAVVEPVDTSADELR